MGTGPQSRSPGEGCPAPPSPARLCPPPRQTPSFPIRPFIPSCLSGLPCRPEHFSPLLLPPRVLVPHPERSSVDPTGTSGGPEWGQDPLALVGWLSGWWAQRESRQPCRLEPRKLPARWTPGARGQEWAPSHVVSLSPLPMLAGAVVTRGEAKTQVSAGRRWRGPGGLGGRPGAVWRKSPCAGWMETGVTQETANPSAGAQTDTASALWAELAPKALRASGHVTAPGLGGQHSR